jgi:hypothetical protein
MIILIAFWDFIHFTVEVVCFCGLVYLCISHVAFFHCFSVSVFIFACLGQGVGFRFYFLSGKIFAMFRQEWIGIRLIVSFSLLNRVCCLRVRYETMFTRHQAWCQHQSAKRKLGASAATTYRHKNHRNSNNWLKIITAITQIILE